MAAVVAGVWLLLGNGVGAADATAIERCREAPDPQARIACLEAALEEGQGVTGDSVEPTLPETESAQKAPAELGAEQLPRTGPAERTEPAAARGLAVERYSKVWFRRLQVHLENGQVWRQIEGDTQEVRASLRRNRTVDIERAMGGYRLRLNEMRRTIRVQRVE